MNRNISGQSPVDRAGQRSIDLNIDELVIRGVPARDRQRLAQEIQQELARLLRENGIPSTPGVLPEKEGPEISTWSQGGESLARQIARNIYQGLGNHS